MGRTRSRPSRVAILEVNTYVSSLANENVAIFDAYSLLVGEKELIQPEPASPDAGQDPGPLASRDAHSSRSPGGPALSPCKSSARRPASPDAGQDPGPLASRDAHSSGSPAGQALSLCISSPSRPASPGAGQPRGPMQIQSEEACSPRCRPRSGPDASQARGGLHPQVQAMAVAHSHLGMLTPRIGGMGSRRVDGMGPGSSGAGQGKTVWGGCL